MKKKMFLVKLVVACMLLSSCGEETETKAKRETKTYRETDNVLYWDEVVLVEETMTEQTIIGW